MDVKSFNLSSYLNYKEQSGDNCGDHEAIFVEECGDMARALQEDGAILVLELFFKNVGYEHQNFFENRDDILKKIDWC
jgi:phage major head subunit gpT-like protein